MIRVGVWLLLTALVMALAMSPETRKAPSAQSPGRDAEVAATAPATQPASTHPSAYAPIVPPRPVLAHPPAVRSAATTRSATSTPWTTEIAPADKTVPATTRPDRTARVFTPATPLLSPTESGPRQSVLPGDDSARAALTRDIQTELRRYGCYDGEIDGDWGPGTARAMLRFTEIVNARLPTRDPDFILLALLRNQSTAGCNGQAQTVVAGRHTAPSTATASTATVHAERHTLPSSTSARIVQVSPSDPATVVTITRRTTTTRAAVTVARPAPTFDSSTRMSVGVITTPSDVTTPGTRDAALPQVTRLIEQDTASDLDANDEQLDEAAPVHRRVTVPQSRPRAERSHPRARPAATVSRKQARRRWQTNLWNRLANQN